MAYSITFSVRGTTLAERTRDQLSEKFQKAIQHFEESVISVDIEITEEASHRGVESDRTVRILVHVPKAVLRIKKRGSELFPVFDQAVDSLTDRLREYKESLKKWHQQASWIEAHVVPDVVDDPVVADNFHYVDYTPVVRVKEISGMPPMTISEAIFQMEMLGRVSFLFLNSTTGLTEMVYKEGGEYLLIRPPRI